MRYLNALRNQWLISRAWMFSTFAFALFSVYLLIVLGSTISKMPTRLIPYEFAATNGPVTVSSGGSASEEYLTRIAHSDLKHYTDWTPLTVERQYAIFANRMTPALYAQVGTDLIAQSRDIAGSERTQTLFVERTEVAGDQVRVSGTLRSWHGSELIESSRKTYTLGYRFSAGVPSINELNAQEGR